MDYLYIVFLIYLIVLATHDVRDALLQKALEDLRDVLFHLKALQPAFVGHGKLGAEVGDGVEDPDVVLLGGN